MPSADGPTYPIDSVDRALSLILEFEKSDRVTITEAGKFLGVSRSTAYRLLSVLEHREFASQDPKTKAFHPGPALLRAGLAAVRRSDLRVTLRPLLEEVVAEVGETAHLVVLQRNEAFYLDCVESSHVVRATGRIGTALPAHVSAGGKVLLANLSPAQLDKALEEKLPAVTRKSKTSATSVRRELATVAKTGWAINDGESEIGLRAVAALIPPERSGTGVATAITVAGPAERFDRGRLEATAKVLLEKIEHFSSS